MIASAGDARGEQGRFREFFRQRRESGHDLDWEGLWTEPFLIPLQAAGVRTILELGCGTGNDAARLAAEGYAVTAIDLSGEAIGQAQARFGSVARFLVADMTERLPFPDRGFDAVMSNVAVHMFPDGVTRAVFAEVGRLVRPGGLFAFHVNALEDRPLRARSLPARELEPGGRGVGPDHALLLRGLPARAPGRMAGAAPGLGPDPAPPDR
jgi:SAM-dependent methyltransferase